ncbi:DM13 domain-containing protein [Nocardia huaxiensis]|uniref:DM13 domain-containing protein n=1 Tax=Nocardia huaxiensis TaxID=2755382 RepID=A0A7D6V5A1_9NOCA|nr:DM13 domain-containing protein [Nocardia huaxiensis]QLY27752.1 DM13 domain-containing protein [Nocardia huaxiensis]UFS98854.1 DM13 domain-containing protein [Nocardia huaxiensis]
MSRVGTIVRSPITWVVTGVLVVALAVGTVYFAPWKLFTSTTVVEAVPTAAAPAVSGAAVEPRTLYTGTLISHEHDTSGTVAVLQLADGRRVLRLENLDTSDGPDLHVWLSDAAVLEGRDGWGVFDDGDHTDLGKLKGNKGSQNYDIPAEVDLAKLGSVTVWCVRFHVSFGAAELRAA